METHLVPGARFVDPKVLARVKDLDLLAQGGRRRLHQRPAPRAVLRRVGRLRRASRVCRRRRHSPRGLAAVRAHGSVLHQAVRGRHERQLLRVARRVEVDVVHQPRRDEARVREVSGGVPGVSVAAAARSRGDHHVRRGRRGARAAVGQALQRAAAHARPAKAERPGRLLPNLKPARRALQASQHRRAHLGSLREPGGHLLDALKPYTYLRQRRRGVSRARSGRD